MARKRRTLLDIIKEYFAEQRRDAQLKQQFKSSVRKGRKRMSIPEYIKYLVSRDKRDKKLQEEFRKKVYRKSKPKSISERIKEAREARELEAKMKAKFKKSVTAPKKKIPFKERVIMLRQQLKDAYHDFFFGEINNFALFNSTIIFVTTYLMVFFANDLAVAMAAKYFKLKPILYYSYIVYLNNSGWYPHAVKRIFITGPFLTLGIGFGSYIVYLLLKDKNVFVRLFFIWTSLIGFANFLAKLMSIPNYKGRLQPTSEMSLGIVTGYLYYSNTFENALAILGFVLTIPVGLLMAKPFVQTAWSSRVIKTKSDKARLIFQVGIIPFIIGTILIFLINYPGNLRANFIIMVALGFVLIWAFMGARAFFEILIYRQKIYEKGRVSIAALSILMAVIFFYKFILSRGLQL